MKYLSLLIVFGTALLHTNDASAYCTFAENRWGPACSVDTPLGQQTPEEELACRTLWDSALQNLPRSMHSIPVYLNFGEETFPVPHPNDPDVTVNIHRSLMRLGLSKEAVVTQVKAAMAHWNNSTAGLPTLFLAGEVSGDTALPENRPIGITVDTLTCFDRNEHVGGRGGTTQPVWVGQDGAYAYRGRASIIPRLHALKGHPPGLCEDLPKDLCPQPKCTEKDGPDCKHVDWTEPCVGFDQSEHTSRIKDGLQHLLVHEFGHTLGLHHNFFDEPESATSCGLGEMTDTVGVMSYDIKLTRPRRDDIEAVRALFGDYLPTAWPLLRWMRQHYLPQNGTSVESDVSTLKTSVPPTLSNRQRSFYDTVALGYADENHQVRVRTISGNTLDPANGADVVLPMEQGKTFDQVAVALQSDSTLEPVVFVAWNEEQTNRLGVDTYWALKPLYGSAWSTFGPDPLITSECSSVPVESNGDEEVDRVTKTLGATYDPVFGDYVVVTTTKAFQPIVSTISSTGILTAGPHRLRKAGAPASSWGCMDDYNVVGSPVCIGRGKLGGSLCLIPVATSGDRSVAGVVTFTRTQNKKGATVVSSAQEYLAQDKNCVGEPCSVEAFGSVSLGWDSRSGHGFLGYGDDRGDVRWLRVHVTNDESVEFYSAALFNVGQEDWNTPGNQKYNPAALDKSPVTVANYLQTQWPVCSYWGATVGGIGWPGSAQAPHNIHAARATCRAVCRDGYIDSPPFGDEQCEPENHGGATCQSLGFDDGYLDCSSTCQFDTSGCFNHPSPPGGGSGNDEDCLDVETCSDISKDGCFPDGPGSFGAVGNIDSSVFNSEPGRYCPGDAICGLAVKGGEAKATCIDCPQAGSGDGTAAYGCGCYTDSDCASTGVGIIGGAPNSNIPMACYGSEDQGWASGPGTCLPAIDAAAPQTGTSESTAAIEEFERTRWLCKQNCASLEAMGGPSVCHFRQGSVNLTYAACVTETCEGAPGEACAEGGGVCNYDADVCQAQCDPSSNGPLGNDDCAKWGFPAYYQCAHGWAAEGLCVPSECAEDPLTTGLDFSECQMFVGAEIF